MEEEEDKEEQEEDVDREEEDFDLESLEVAVEEVDREAVEWLCFVEGEVDGVGAGLGAWRLGLEAAFFSPAVLFLAPDVPGGCGAALGLPLTPPAPETELLGGLCLRVTTTVGLRGTGPARKPFGGTGAGAVAEVGLTRLLLGTESLVGPSGGRLQPPGEICMNIRPPLPFSLGSVAWGDLGLPVCEVVDAISPHSEVWR